MEGRGLGIAGVEAAELREEQAHAGISEDMQTEGPSSQDTYRVATGWLLSLLEIKVTWLDILNHLKR